MSVSYSTTSNVMSASSTDMKPTTSHHSINPQLPTSSNENYPFVLSKNSTLKDFLNQNKLYVEKMNENHPEIFPSNAQGQSPHTLYIGCSDSRYSEHCVNVLPGEVFVHRNIANVIASHDVSSAGAIQFAIEVLKVKKIIVCGHTDCGGIWASLSSKKIGGVLDQWLYPVRHVRSQHLKELSEIEEPKLKCLKLSELNVINSVQQLKRHPSLINLLKRGQIEVYGLLYDVATGELKELEIPIDELALLFHVSDESDVEDVDPHL